MKDEVDKFLRTRVVFEDTGAVSDDASKLAQTDLFSPGISTRSDERVVSLPVTAYPSITLQGGETATGGLVGAMAALGFGTSDQTTLTLDFNDVRTYWVPKVIASRYRDYALNKFGGDDLDVAAVQLPSKIAAKAEMEGHKSSGTRCLTLAIVTQVYLTRKIDYTYADREIVAAGLKIATQQGKVQDVAAPPAITVNVLQSGDDAKNDSEAAAKIAEALRTSTAGVGSGAEGGSFSFVSWNARGLTFQKTFQRPVAIGWDGFEFGFTDTNLSQRPCQNINNLM